MNADRHTTFDFDACVTQGDAHRLLDALYTGGIHPADIATAFNQAVVWAQDIVVRRDALDRVLGGESNLTLELGQLLLVPATQVDDAETQASEWMGGDRS